MIVPCLAKLPGRTPSGLLGRSCTFSDQSRPRLSGQQGGSAALQLEQANFSLQRKLTGLSDLIPFSCLILSKMCSTYFQIVNCFLSWFLGNIRTTSISGALSGRA